MKNNLLTRSFVFSLLLITLPAAASTWCGENGVVRLSFTEGDALQPTKTMESGGKGITTVDLYAYITDADAVKLDGVAFLHMAALEFTLLIEGAEGFITSQEIPVPNRSVGRRPGEVLVGMDPGISVKNGRALLVHWKVLFQGQPENVVFKLDPSALISCERIEGCPEGQPYGLYTGSDSDGQLGSLFGLGYVPAYLNFSGEPDLEARHSRQSWQDVGVYQKR